MTADVRPTGDYLASGSTDEIDNLTVTITVVGRPGGSFAYHYGVPESAGWVLDDALDCFAREWPDLLDLPVTVKMTGERFGYRRVFQSDGTGAAQ